jgi:hypothetical protein
MDKLAGKNKLSRDDPLFALIEKLVHAEPAFRQVDVAKDA